MAIGDANALASAVASKSLPDALQAYQDRRLVTTAKHVSLGKATQAGSRWSDMQNYLCTSFSSACKPAASLHCLTLFGML